jgi:hypothetical protein
MEWYHPDWSASEGRPGLENIDNTVSTHTAETKQVIVVNYAPVGMPVEVISLRQK